MLSIVIGISSTKDKYSSSALVKRSRSLNAFSLKFLIVILSKSINFTTLLEGLVQLS